MGGGVMGVMGWFSGRNRIRELEEALRVKGLEEENSRLKGEVGEVAERLGRLMFDLEQSGWKAVNGESDDGSLSLSDVQDLARRARDFYRLNPLINRGTEVQSEYVWANGVVVKGRDKKVDALIQEFIARQANQNALFGPTTRMLLERQLILDGNLFFLFFVEPLTGRVLVSQVPFFDVKGLVTNPKNRGEVWFYEVAQGRERVLHPTLDYRPAKIPREYDGVRVATSRILHVKVGSLMDQPWGVPEVDSAIAWAKAYTNWLEDWSTITRSLTRFSWKASGIKKAGEITALQAKFGSALGNGAGETNPSPVAGSILTVPEGRDLQPIKTAGAIPLASDGRMLRLMAVAAMGWPDSFFGDMDQSSLATAKSLDRPTELKVIARQEFWAGIYRRIFHHVMMESVIASGGDLKGAVFRTAQTPNELQLRLRGAKSDSVEIKFPPVVVEQLLDQVSAIVDAATLKGRMPAGTMTPATLARLLHTALGNRDAEAELDELAELVSAALIAHDKDAKLGPGEEEADPPAVETPPSEPQEGSD